MKILYKPVAMLAAIIGARLGRNVFRGLWAKIDDAEPPGPTTAEASWGKAVGAAALEGATLAAAGALAGRSSAKFFHHLTGIWPGEKGQKPAEE